MGTIINVTRDEEGKCCFVTICECCDSENINIFPPATFQKDKDGYYLNGHFLGCLADLTIDGQPATHQIIEQMVCCLNGIGTLDPTEICTEGEGVANIAGWEFQCGAVSAVRQDVTGWHFDQPTLLELVGAPAGAEITTYSIGVYPCGTFAAVCTTLPAVTSGSVRKGSAGTQAVRYDGEYDRGDTILARGSREPISYERKDPSQPLELFLFDCSLISLSICWKHCVPVGDNGGGEEVTKCVDSAVIPSNDWSYAIFGGVRYDFSGGDPLTWLQNIISSNGEDPANLTLDGLNFAYCTDSEVAPGFTELGFGGATVDACVTCLGTLSYNWLGMSGVPLQAWDSPAQPFRFRLAFGNWNAGNSILSVQAGDNLFSVNNGPLMPLTVDPSPGSLGMIAYALGTLKPGVNVIYGTITDANGLKAEQQYEIELNAVGQVVGLATASHKGINGGNNGTGATNANCIGDGISDLALIANINNPASYPNGTSQMVPNTGFFYQGSDGNTLTPIALSGGMVGYKNHGIINDSVSSCNYTLGLDYTTTSGNQVFVHSTTQVLCDGAVCGIDNEVVTISRTCETTVEPEPVINDIVITYELTEIDTSVGDIEEHFQITPTPIGSYANVKVECWKGPDYVNLYDGDFSDSITPDYELRDGTMYIKSQNPLPRPLLFKVTIDGQEFTRTLPAL